MIVKEREAQQQRREARERFANAQRMEMDYMRALRQLTKQIGHIVNGMAPGGVVRNSIELQGVLQKYSEAIAPWARSVAEKMLARVAKKDENSWAKLGKSIGVELRKELQDAPVGDMLRQFLSEQVELITSLPIEAGERVHKLVMEALTNGQRADEIAKDVLATGKVTESRAKLIARTEVARVASGLTMQRAKHVGVTHYVWRTSGDATVRESHKKMNGAVVPFDAAPEVEPGKRYHAGMIYNCRCYPEPILTRD